MLPNEASELIQLHRISRTYDVGAHPVHALQNLDLSIREGEFVAITGSSGSGKSTLLNILGCLDRPTSGQYWLSGQDVALMDDDVLTRIRCLQIGFVFQTFNLLPRLTAEQNVSLPLLYARTAASQRHQRVAAMLDRVGLGDRMHHRPAQLSGGQCQRVAIARALMNRPAILLADEPTGNLDSTTSREILQLFGDLHGEHHTIILVTHDMEVARSAERIVVLRDGQLETEDANRD